MSVPEVPAYGQCGQEEDRCALPHPALDPPGPISQAAGSASKRRLKAGFMLALACTRPGKNDHGAAGFARILDVDIPLFWLMGLKLRLLEDWFDFE